VPNGPASKGELRLLDRKDNFAVVRLPGTPRRRYTRPQPCSSHGRAWPPEMLRHSDVRRIASGLGDGVADPKLAGIGNKQGTVKGAERQDGTPRCSARERRTAQILALQKVSVDRGLELDALNPHLRVHHNTVRGRKCLAPMT
jgi:hypothetical protein